MFLSIFLFLFFSCFQSIQLFLKSSQGPIDVYLSSEDHSPFDVPEDPQDDDDDDEPTDCSDDDGPMEHTQTPSFLSMSSTGESHTAIWSLDYGMSAIII